MQAHGVIEKLKICSIKSVKCMDFKFWNEYFTYNITNIWDKI